MFTHTKQFCFVMASTPSNQSRRSRHSWKKCVYSSHPVLGKEENKRGLSSPAHCGLCHTQLSLSKAAPIMSAKAEKQRAHKHSLTSVPHW